MIAYGLVSSSTLSVGSRARCRENFAVALCLAPLGACSTVTDLWGLWGNKDNVNIPDDPADRLYNEGLYLLNSKKDYKAAAKRFEEVDREHPYRSGPAKRC